MNNHGMKDLSIDYPRNVFNYNSKKSEKIEFDINKPFYPLTMSYFHNVQALLVRSYNNQVDDYMSSNEAGKKKIIEKIKNGLPPHVGDLYIKKQIKGLKAWNPSEHVQDVDLNLQ